MKTVSSIITDEELAWLDDFLASDAAPEEAMDVSTLEGFLTALALAPRLVMPSRWLPWVWDFERGEEEVIFDNEEQANRVLNAIMSLSNHVSHAFQTDPASFEPVFYRRAEWGAAEWCEGFLKATRLFDAEMWSALWLTEGLQHIGKPGRVTMLTPFLRLGDPDGAAITAQEGDAERWVAEIVPALARINDYWADTRRELAGEMANEAFAPGMPSAPVEPPAMPFRRGPKVGRNEPCPCGSGKKFKKCCGKPPTIH